jgi:Outer membrane protein beta-barrel domain
MYNLLRKQIILFCLLFFYSVSIFAQKEQYRAEHDNLKYYFGATLGFNTGYLSAKKSEYFLSNDSIQSAEPASSGGISIGIHATARLTKRLQARINPQIILGGARYFNYTVKDLSGTIKEDNFTLPTTLLSFPISFKFNSDRIDNFRTYLLFGVKADVDLSANSSARNLDNYIKLKKYCYGVEAGVGFNLFLQYFTLTPEIKISYGLNNILERNPDLKYSAVFTEIQSRMIMFSLHFED